MCRFFVRTLATMALLVAVPLGMGEGMLPTSQAETFFSGRITVDTTVAGGTDVFNNVKNLGFLSGGVSYNNQWTSGTGGMSAAGNKVTSMGIVPIGSVSIGTNTFPTGTGTNLVAVYALEGLNTAAPPNVQGNFDPGTGPVPGSTIGGNAGGVIKIFDRSSLGITLDVADVNTWVPDIADASNGLVAELQIANRADAYAQGSPGGSATTAPTISGGGIDDVNTFPGETTGAFGAEGDVKAELVDFGTLFANLDVSSPGFIQLTDDFFVNLDQEAPAPGSQPIPTDLADFGTLFDSLLDNLVAGDHLFEGNVAGDDFNTSQNFATGDITLSNTGGLAIPGGQFIPEPESGTLLMWSLLGVVGWVSVRWYRQREYGVT